MVSPNFFVPPKFFVIIVHRNRSPAHSTGQGSAYSHSSDSESAGSDSYTTSGSGSETDVSALSRSPSPQREKRHQAISKHRHKKKRTKEALSLEREKEGERGRQKKRKREVSDDTDHRPKNKRRRHHKKSGKSRDPSTDPLQFSSDAATSDTAHRRHRHHHHHRKKTRRHKHRHVQGELAGGDGYGDTGKGSDLEVEGNQADKGEVENPENHQMEMEQHGGDTNEDDDRSVPISGGGGGGSPAITVNEHTESVAEGGGSGPVSGPTETQTTGKVEEQPVKELAQTDTKVEVESQSEGGGGGGVAKRHGSCDQLLDDIDQLLADEQTPTLEDGFAPFPTTATKAATPADEKEEVEKSLVNGSSNTGERDKTPVVDAVEGEVDSVSLHTEETIDVDTPDDTAGQTLPTAPVSSHLTSSTLSPGQCRVQ